MVGEQVTQTFFGCQVKALRCFFSVLKTLEACRIFETNIRMSGESSKFCKDLYFSSIFTWWFAFLRDETVLLVATYFSCDRFLSGNFRMAASYIGEPSCVTNDFCLGINMLHEGSPIENRMFFLGTSIR